MHNALVVKFAKTVHVHVRMEKYFAMEHASQEIVVSMLNAQVDKLAKTILVLVQPEKYFAMEYASQEIVV